MLDALTFTFHALSAGKIWHPLTTVPGPATIPLTTPVAVPGLPVVQVPLPELLLELVVLLLELVVLLLELPALLLELVVLLLELVVLLLELVVLLLELVVLLLVPPPEPRVPPVPEPLLLLELVVPPPEPWPLLVWLQPTEPMSAAALHQRTCFIRTFLLSSSFEPDARCEASPNELASRRSSPRGYAA
jgi:hypothetical protein